MNSLLSSMLTTLNGAASATRAADEARVSTARAQSAKAEASGQFSQLLRSYDKPAENPKPAAEASPATAAPPDPKNRIESKTEGKTEIQRQEARSASLKKSPEAAAKNSAEPSASAYAAKPVAQASEEVIATTAEKKSADDAAESVEPVNDGAAAGPGSAIAALLTPLTPTPLLLALQIGAAKPPGSAIAADDAAETDDGKDSARSSVKGGENTPPLGIAAKGAQTAHAAHAAAENFKAKADDASEHDSAARTSATDFATAVLDAVQAQPAALRNAEAGQRAQSAGTMIEGITSASAQAPQTPLSPAGTDPGSTARVTVASPLYTPGFAPEMAARLSVLAADGVQTAQLHLNPAEMGPVAVQIVIEGQQARIEFQADQANTRAVLERSLPDLAAALRESGLTLSGGGVFQQFADQDPSRAQPRNDGKATRRNSREDSDTLTTLPPRAAAVARQTQGVVDLYA